MERELHLRISKWGREGCVEIERSHLSEALTSEESSSKDDCIICGKWPAQDRWALCEMTTALPLQETGSVANA